MVISCGNIEEIVDNHNNNGNNNNTNKSNKRRRKCSGGGGAITAAAEEVSVTVVSLPEDIVFFEILSRLPARFIRTNINHPLCRTRRFIDRHVLRAQPGGVIAQYIPRNRVNQLLSYRTYYLEISSSASVVNVADWGAFPSLLLHGNSCDGLVMFLNRYIIHVYNPATSESFQVPMFDDSTLVTRLSVALARLPSTGEIKLFHLDLYPPTTTMTTSRLEDTYHPARVLVFSLGADAHWRDITTHSAAVQGGGGGGVLTLPTLYFSGSRSTGTCVYWFSTECTVVLDAAKETIRVVTNPFPCSYPDQFLTMGSGDSCSICAIVPVSSSMFVYDMYILDAGADDAWSPPLRMDYHLLLRCYGYSNIKFIIFLGIFNRGLLILVEEKNKNAQWCFTYDLDTHTVTRVNMVTQNNMRSSRRKKVLTFRKRFEGNCSPEKMLSNLEFKRPGLYNIFTHTNTLVSPSPPLRASRTSAKEMPT